MLGEWTKQQVEEQERREERERLDRQYKHLATIPANTFAAIYPEFQEDFFSVKFNDEWYGDWQIYHASLARDEGYEDFI
ncbi:hypothetical protein [Rosenbergiella epipactidis]|uniref:hypothetical protein n=1 Tax=Rosenbergiella epipactidis TaxID=1544694 RepID=UPI001F4E78FB|nr:hypothetical protein [Rosenbergiella epipactidis]